MIIYMPRAFGGTLIVNVLPPTPFVPPPVNVLFYVRSGVAIANVRAGNITVEVRGT